MFGQHLGLSVQMLAVALLSALVTAADFSYGTSAPDSSMNSYEPLNTAFTTDTDEVTAASTQHHFATYDAPTSDGALHVADATDSYEPLDTDWSTSTDATKAAAHKHFETYDAPASDDELQSYEPYEPGGTAARLSPPPPGPAASPPPHAWIDARFWTHRGTLRTNFFGGSSGAGDGTELKVKGVSWFGLESKPCFAEPHTARTDPRALSVLPREPLHRSRCRCFVGGLDQMPVEMGAAFLRRHSFNAVRVPLAVDALLS